MQDEHADVFDEMVKVYDYFANRSADATPLLDRCIRILQVNAGLGLEKIFLGNTEKQTLNPIWERLNAANLRRKDAEFVRRVFTMSAMAIGSAIADSLTHPERNEENRQELIECLEIIKYGSLAR